MQAPESGVGWGIRDSVPHQAAGISGPEASARVAEFYLTWNPGVCVCVCVCVCGVRAYVCTCVSTPAPPESPAAEKLETPDFLPAVLNVSARHPS